MKEHFERNYHHYLNKKTPQTQIKMYQLNAQTSEIEDEQIFVAEQNFFDEEEKSNISSKKKSFALVEIDIDQSLQNIEVRKRNKEEYEIKLAAEREQKLLDAMEIDDDGEVVTKEIELRVNPMLWTEKYTSYKFIDLLTDEVTNRNMLIWLKSWDEIVFPENGKLNLKMPDSMKRFPQNNQILSVPYRNNSKWPLAQDPKNNIQFRNPTYVQNEISPDQIFNRLNKQVLLLYGPPGCGKSTLARVISNHCGYKTIEINASDERTGDKILERIKNSTEMNSYFGRDNNEDVRKPVCLIIDEVDGALGNGDKSDNAKGIQMIVDYLKKCINYVPKQKTNKADLEDDEIDDELNHEKKEENGDNEDNEKSEKISKRSKKAKKDDGIRELRRPIIFICNDPYAKALRPLKEIALEIKINEANGERLLKRLRQICKEQKVNINDKILRELCHETNFDARSCINTLQFMAASQRETGERITEDLVSKACGQLYHGKDKFDNIFSVIQQIMHTRSLTANPVKLINEVKNIVFSHGDTQLINDFLYNNYANSVSYFDDDLEKTAFFLDTLSRSQVNENFINRTQNYEMMGTQYLPAYTFKRFCSGREVERLQYPRLFYNMKVEKSQNKAIFEQLIDLQSKTLSKRGVQRIKQNQVQDEERYRIGQCSSLQTAMSKRRFNLDLLPYICQMIHPNIRDINIALLNKFEKEIFQQTIEIMVLFDITLKQDTQQLDSQIAQFEPDISKVVHFQGSRKEFMRSKTQVLIMQNYETIKQKMLTASTIEERKQSEQENKTQNSGKAVAQQLTGLGFFANVQQNQKKRKYDEISNAGKNIGRFIYKFKEGHSKNFKRELKFDELL